MIWFNLDKRSDNHVLTDICHAVILIFEILFSYDSV